MSSYKMLHLNNSMIARGGQTVVDNCLIFKSATVSNYKLYLILYFCDPSPREEVTPGIFSNFLFYPPFYISGKS